MIGKGMTDTAGKALLTFLAYLAGGTALNLGLWFASGESIRLGSLFDTALLNMGGVLGAWTLVRCFHAAGWRSTAALTLSALQALEILMALTHPTDDTSLRIIAALLALALTALLIWPVEWKARRLSWPA